MPCVRFGGVLGGELEVRGQVLEDITYPQRSEDSTFGQVCVEADGLIQGVFYCCLSCYVVFRLVLFGVKRCEGSEVGHIDEVNYFVFLRAGETLFEGREEV